MRIIGCIAILSLLINLRRGVERFSLKKEFQEGSVQKNDTVKNQDYPRTFSDMADALSLQHSEKRFLLTEEGKNIIRDARSQHTAPPLLPAEKFTEGLCAGYLYELTARMRWPTAPLHIGMMHPITKVAADARELPYSYRYKGWTIAIEIASEVGRQVKADPHQYPMLVTAERLKEFFVQAFDPKTYFGDIGFLYAETRMTHMLGTFDNYNSHIGKNFWRSQFTLSVATPQATTEQSFKKLLGCNDALRPVIKPLLAHYDRTVNSEAAALVRSGEAAVLIDKQTGIPRTLQDLDTVLYEDITVVHFFNGPQVDSLLHLACQGIFYPINVLQIHPDFLEKM